MVYRRFVEVICLSNGKSDYFGSKIITLRDVAAYLTNAVMQQPPMQRANHRSICINSKNNSLGGL